MVYLWNVISKVKVYAQMHKNKSKGNFMFTITVIFVLD